MLHDARLDKVALIVPQFEISAGNSKAVSFGDAHTHVERVSFSDAMQELSSSVPRIQPREDHKKHLIPNRVARGHHTFDSYNLPIV